MDPLIKSSRTEPFGQIFMYKISTLRIIGFAAWNANW
jgi:hypothetical protein